MFIPRSAASVQHAQSRRWTDTYGAVNLRQVLVVKAASFMGCCAPCGAPFVEASSERRVFWHCGQAVMEVALKYGKTECHSVLFPLFFYTTLVWSELVHLDSFH